MDEAVPNEPPLAARASEVPVLSYAASTPGRMVTVGRYANDLEAALPSAELSADGIPSIILNGNVNALGIHFASFSEVELQVHELYAERARDILSRIRAEDLEPAAVQPDQVLDADGNSVRLATVETFEKVREMFDARTILGSSRVDTYLPRLVRRGEAPPGVGRRFVLRVRESDLKRARDLLKEAEDEEEDDDQRCPKCGSRRTYPVSKALMKLLAFFRLVPRPEDLADCLACGYRGPSAEFNRSRQATAPNPFPDKKEDSHRE